MPWKNVYRYWSNHRVEGRPPARADLDPMIEVPHLVPNMFLVDVAEDGFRFRLIGSEIVRRAKHDFTGRVIDRSLLGDETLRSWRRVMRKVAEEKTPVLYVFDPQARNTANAVGLLMPLVNRSGVTEMLLGALFFSGARELRRPSGPGRVHEIPIPAGDCS